MSPLRPTGSALSRKRFSDITNITSNSRSEAEGQENPNFQHNKFSQDYLARILKENIALLRLLDERNQVVEITGMELQKLRRSLQNMEQQNWQLAQANSVMMAELNMGKDRLKATQHELGCTAALLRARTLELEEAKKFNEKHKQHSESPNEVAADQSHPISCKKSCSLNKKRTLRSRSLGPTTVARQETAKLKDEGRRKTMRWSNDLRAELSKPNEDSFNIAGYSSLEHKGQSDSPQHQNQMLQRFSIGRPMRRAAVKVNSYKEVPLNVKMRRNE